MVRFETSWENQWGAEVLWKLWKLVGETGLAADSGVRKGEENKIAAGKVQESGTSRQENTVVVRDYGYGLRRSCEINDSSGRISGTWVRNPLLYEPLFITLVDLLRNRRLGEMAGIEMALFFPNTSFENRESAEGESLIEYAFALELFFFLIIASSGNVGAMGNEKGSEIADTLNRASAVLRNNQFQGIYNLGKRAGSLIVSRKAWSYDYSPAEDSKKEKQPSMDLREFSFFPFRGKGFMSFERGTLEFRTREDRAPCLTIYPSGEESYSIPLPEGRGELYFFMDILEVLLGIKERPLHSPSLVSALVLRAEEELEYTRSGKNK